MSTSLNTTFYVGFKFLLQERKDDFIWFLTILRTLYRRLDLKDPKVIVTDRDIALMAAIREITLNKRMSYIPPRGSPAGLLMLEMTDSHKELVDSTSPPPPLVTVIETSYVWHKLLSH